MPAFTGNGTDHMNIKIVTATLSGLSLGVGDEIAVFDGAVCCGVVVLTQEIVKTNPASFGLIAASKADVGTNNGYTPGNSIQFKVWDQSASREYQVIRVVFFDPLTGLPTTVKPFTVNSTAFVSLQVNFKPTANAGPDQTVNEKEPVVLNGSQSSDPESDALTYTWTSLDGVQLQAANTANPTFTAPESTRDASYRFVLKTSDGLLESDPDTVVVSVIDVFNPTTHFQTVWTGNGTEHMNIYVVSALLDGIALEPDDEVAVFDGPLCVGAKKLIHTIDGQNNLQIVASLNTGDGLGYTPGDTILIRVYDHSANKETDIVQATYYNDNPTWLTSGRYAIGASSYISVEALTRVEQSLLLKAGWNMKSLMVTPDKANLFEVLQPLAETGNLRKVMDEKGQAIEHWG
ncbi:MAG TPA: hypothetical protein DD409_06180, partial [Bacteroidales bacterium]|nr:hypothetical protein [Bacteroidales bacterium]